MTCGPAASSDRSTAFSWAVDSRKTLWRWAQRRRPQSGCDRCPVYHRRTGQPRGRNQSCSSSVKVQEDPRDPGHEESGRPKKFEGVPEESLRPEVGGRRRVSLPLLRVDRKWSSPSGTGTVPPTGTSRGRRSSRSHCGNPFLLFEGGRGGERRGTGSDERGERCPSSIYSPRFICS